jgi:hypothetical protein
MIKISNTLFFHCSISNKDNQIATDVVFGMVVVDGAPLVPPRAKDPEDNPAPLAVAIRFATPSPAKVLEDDITPLVA